MKKTDQDQPLTKKEFFDAIENILKPSFDDIYSQLGNIHHKLEEHEVEMTRMRSLMVTKPYLDDKLADMDGRWNMRFFSLIEVLHEKDLLKTRDVKKIQRSTA